MLAITARFHIVSWLQWPAEVITSMTSKIYVKDWEWSAGWLRVKVSSTSMASPPYTLAAFALVNYSGLWTYGIVQHVYFYILFFLYSRECETGEQRPWGSSYSPSMYSTWSALTDWSLVTSLQYCSLQESLPPSYPQVIEKSNYLKTQRAGSVTYLTIIWNAAVAMIGCGGCDDWVRRLRWSVATAAKVALVGGNSCVVGRLQRLQRWCQWVALVATLELDGCDSCLMFFFFLYIKFFRQNKYGSSQPHHFQDSIMDWKMTMFKYTSIKREVFFQCQHVE
jgi:hypothetical protein